MEPKTSEIPIQFYIIGYSSCAERGNCECEKYTIGFTRRSFISNSDKTQETLRATRLLRKGLLFGTFVFAQSGFTYYIDGGFETERKYP